MASCGQMVSGLPMPLWVLGRPITNRPQIANLPHKCAACLAEHERPDPPLADEIRDYRIA